MQMMKFSIDHALDRVAWIAPDGQFLYANEAAYKEMGYSREEFLSLKVSDLDPDYPPEVWAEHYKKLKKRGSFRVDTRHISKDGQIQFIEVSANRMEFEGKEFLCSFGRDMTERKKAEENLQKAYDEIKLLKERLEVENIYLRDQISVQSTHKDILGKSDAMKYVLYKIKQVAPSDSTVLILGETGTGKELVAEAVHSESSRRNRPLVKVNCAALPSNLIESELFGREKGADRTF
jgi:PAS domain S-box-containing protein